MSLLRYVNLPIGPRPDIVLKNTVFGLEDHYRFLERNKKYLESPKAVKYLEWEKITEFEEDFPVPKKGAWVQLLEPENAQENFEAVFKLFLDESNTSVYEADKSNWQEVGSAVRECSHCTNKNGTPKKLYPTPEHAQEAIDYLGMNLKMYECPHQKGWHLSKDIFGKSLRFERSNDIRILDRNPEKEWLLLERLPEKSILVLRPNTYQIQCQIEAIQELRNRPKAQHLPLLRLFEGLNLQSKCKKEEFIRKYNFVTTQKPSFQNELFLPTSYTFRARKHNDYARSRQKTVRNSQHSRAKL